MGAAVGACSVVTEGVERAALMPVASGERGWEGGGPCAGRAHAGMETPVLSSFKTVRYGGRQDLGVGPQDGTFHSFFELSPLSSGPQLQASAILSFLLLLPLPCVFLC